MHKSPQARKDRRTVFGNEETLIKVDIGTIESLLPSDIARGVNLRTLYTLMPMEKICRGEAGLGRCSAKPVYSKELATLRSRLGRVQEIFRSCGLLTACWSQYTLVCTIIIFNMTMSWYCL